MSFLKNLKISLRQFTVLVLLGLSVYLQSPVVAAVAALALFIKEGREHLEHKTKVIELQVFERKLDAQAEEMRQIRNAMNNMVQRHAQTFGE